MPTISCCRLLLAVCALSLVAPAQEPVPPSSDVATITLDSGAVANTTLDPALQDTAAPIWSQIVQLPNSGWMRLRYGETVLSGDPEPGGHGSYLRLTSLADGAVQTQHSIHIRQWRSTSAYFNGSAIRIELMAYPGTGASRFLLREIEYAIAPTGEDSICGATDNRVLSSDNRCARNRPGGCTSWMINDCGECFLTAGHCAGSLQVIQFNVPLSSSTGSTRQPPPSDQFAVDADSLQTNFGQGIGNDYAYFGVFRNSTTGWTPLESYPSVSPFVLATTPPAVSGQSIRITGYGSTSAPVSPTLNLVQKTHSGPYASFNGTTVRYTTDTTGGNSGSPVIDESTGTAIGIHTHAGCNTNPGTSNQGTGINLPELQAALARPLGVCRAVSFSYPGGLPSRILDGAARVRMIVTADPKSPAPNTAELIFDIGTGFVTTPMTMVGPDTYEGTLPATCPTPVSFYFAIRTTTGERVLDPGRGPDAPYVATSSTATRTSVAYDFQTSPPGWSVTNNSSLSAGGWTRAVPVGSGGARRDPPSDFDGSGACWLTGNGNDEDVDGGPTTLTTEEFDLSALPDPQLSYARWHRSDDGDPLRVEVSDNGGATWSLLEEVTTDDAVWTERSFSLGSRLSSRSRVRVRFSSTDSPNNSVTESAIDAFRIGSLSCTAWTTFGTGCAGSAGTPTLDSSTSPTIGQSFPMTLTGVPAGSGLTGVIGFSSSSAPGITLPLDLSVVGMSGCSLYTNIVVTNSITNVGGIGNWTINVPSDSNLAGVDFYAQAFVIDPAANALGLTTSNAGQGHIDV